MVFFGLRAIRAARVLGKGRYGAVCAVLLAAACHAAAPKTLPATDNGALQGSLCDLISFDDAARALGAPPEGSTDTTDAGNLNPGCSWMSQAGALGQTPRLLVLTVWRKTALQRQGAPLFGRDLYTHNVNDLTNLYGAVTPLYGVGDEAMLGEKQQAKTGFEGKIVALKGEDVLTMQMTGANRAAFEDIARRVAAAM